MLPTLFKLGGLPVSSFGFFLLLSFFLSSFIIWRIIRFYDVDEEKTTDLLLLTLIVSLLTSRLYFIAAHLQVFDSLEKIILINKYPGLSFWGAFIGGFLSLRLFSLRFKLSFWKIADYTQAALFLSLSISSLGCLLSSCQIGLPSNLPVAIRQVGFLDKRFPIQVIESLIFFIGFLYLWKASLKFHFDGQITAKALMLLGFLKLCLEPFKETQNFLGPLTEGTTWALLIFGYGVVVYYLQSKKSLVADLRYLLSLFKSSSKRQALVLKLVRSWYNFKVNLKVSALNFKRKVFKTLNVKSNPTEFR